MNSVAEQLQQLLQQRAQQAPNIASDYSSALSTAADQDQKSIDDLRGIYSDPSKFERSPISALGLGLMKGTKSGRFNESMYNGLAAHSAAMDYNQEQNLSREEKLAKLSAIEAQLTRQRGQDQLGVYDTTGKVITNMQGDQSAMADLQLQSQPKGPRALAPGEEGPEAPGSDIMSQSMLVYNDYVQNPQKYSGPQGQAMVTNAIDVIKNERVAQRYADAATVKANRPGPGQVALDKKFGQEVADWYSNGGESDYQKQITQLKGVHTRLSDPQKETTGAITGRMPDWANAWINPDAVNSREQVAEVVQRNLKNILGAQFTQKEGDNLISRAYNPALDEATNAKRVKALVTQMEKAHQVKEAAIQYFEENGSLQGFKFNLPTMADFERAIDNAELSNDGPADAGQPGGAPQDQGPPPEALDILRGNPTPEAKAWFEHTFNLPEGGADEMLLDTGAE
jgi:hypothetical protein